MRLILTVLATLVVVPALADPIRVYSAQYGRNCGADDRGNVTGFVADTCDGRYSCAYPVDHRVIGDPAYGCTKDFRVTWSCGGPRHRTWVRPEASGRTAYLECR